MAKIGVTLKIDVSKIDKASLYKGQKGTYLDIKTFIELDEFDQYGNSGMVTQEISKERSQAGEKGAILGNSKVFWKDEGQQNAQPQRQAQQAPPQNNGFQQQPQQQRAPQQQQQQRQPQQYGGNDQGGFKQPQQQQAPQSQQQAPSFNDFDDDIPF